MFVRPENFQQNVRKNKDTLKEQAAFITEEIVQRGGIAKTFDFRCMVIMAQWLAEQGGYTMTPEGNNPGNAVEKGDAGTFTRSYNTELNRKTGVREKRPDVKFAKYSSMIYARKRKFDLLQRNWSTAYQAVLTGASCDAYTSGLFPGGNGDYATETKEKYMSGMRFRLNQVVSHFIMTAEDDIKECEGMVSAIPATPPTNVSLDYRNSIELNKNMVSVLKMLLDSLKELEKRVKAGGRIQP